MISVTEAKQILEKNSLPKKTKHASLEQAFRLVLAEDVHAYVDVPRFDNSAMDGYALICDEVERFELVGEIKAGDSADLTLNRGEAVRIMTGAMMPQGADTVVMREYTKEEEGGVIVETSLKQGEHIRRRGEEIQAGEIALKQGTLLTPAAVSYLASVGVDSVLIHTPPKVSIVVTGNELVNSLEELKPGQIIDSNTLTLKTALKDAGIQEILCFRALDDPASLRETIDQALQESDCVLVSGGVSVGHWDFTKDVLNELGVQELFWRVAQKPGKPLLVARKGDKTVFGLPGNPASVLVCFYEYVYGYLREAMGRRDSGLKKLTATFVGEAKKKLKLTHYARAELFFQNHQPHVRLVAGQESFRLGSFAQANAIVVLPEGKEKIIEGDKVEVHLIP